MLFEEYFHNCSREYIEASCQSLYQEIARIIGTLPKRTNQTEINNDLFWSLRGVGWSYDTKSKISEVCPKDLNTEALLDRDPFSNNDRHLCKSSTTLNASWHADFAKCYNSGVVQIEAQFGQVASMFKDFCGFSIAYYERRLVLGIEIVISEPQKLFFHRKGAIAGMAYFDVAKKTLPTIGLNCPIWLLGIKE